jgi:hypothetical protein
VVAARIFLVVGLPTTRAAATAAAARRHFEKRKGRE